MERAIRGVGFLLVFMRVVLPKVPRVTVGSVETVFSDEITTDFARGGIDVAGLIRQDLITLPLVGSCGLAAKFSTPHRIDTATVHGTFRTTFEFLTEDCTAEFRRDAGSCTTLNSACAVCFSFPLDMRTHHRPWGYCSNFKFQVSYLWVPIVTATLTLPVTKVPNQIFTPLALPINVQSISSDGYKPPISSGFGIGRTGEGSDPAALASIYKYMLVLSRLVVKDSTIKDSPPAGGRSDTGCDWRFSNLVPVAWDGVQNVLSAGQALQSCDTQYAFVMQYDGNLVLYKRGPDGEYEWNARWATYSHYNDPFQHNCTLELQPNGNLVVWAPHDEQRWTSNRTSPAHSYSGMAM